MNGTPTFHSINDGVVQIALVEGFLKSAEGEAGKKHIENRLTVMKEEVNRLMNLEAEEKESNGTYIGLTRE